MPSEAERTSANYSYKCITNPLATENTNKKAIELIDNKKFCKMTYEEEQVYCTSKLKPVKKNDGLAGICTS